MCVDQWYTISACQKHQQRGLLQTEHDAVSFEPRLLEWKHFWLLIDSSEDGAIAVVAILVGPVISAQWAVDVVSIMITIIWEGTPNREFCNTFTVSSACACSNLYGKPFILYGELLIFLKLSWISEDSWWVTPAHRFLPTEQYSESNSPLCPKQSKCAHNCLCGNQLPKTGAIMLQHDKKLRNHKLPT